MVRLRPERYAAERAHKLHPCAAGPYRVRRVINSNAYDIAIPSDWGIPSTFNICDLVLYKGPLEVPTEPGLPLDSSESSLFAPEENDGPHSTTSNITVNSPESGGVQEDPPGSQWENDAAAESTGRHQHPVKPTAEDDGAELRTGRRQRPAKPTARPSEFYYF